MSHDIKSLRPSKKSRYEQGYININSCKKIFESQRGVPVIYRSSLEKKFVQWCENNEKIERWGSECVQVPYYDPRDEKTHTYNPDFMIQMVGGQKIAVEIKPYAQTQKPPYPYKDDYQWNQYIRNQLKWKAAVDFFTSRDIKFIIITEKFFAV